MPDGDGSLTDELVAGAVESIPLIGPLSAVFAKRMSKKIREEWARNNSEALRAAERMCGLCREELADRISEDPRLIPLLIRVLYTAGMTGQGTTLRALGTALGGAVRDPKKIDEAEILLIGMANLRRHHIAILEIMTESRPHPTKPDTFFTNWTSATLAEKSTYSHDFVNICVAGLVQSGLISQVGDAYGLCYEISDLGRTALEVINELDKEPHSKPH